MTDYLSAQRYARATVRRLVGVDDEEDVLQEAALKAWQKREQFRERSRFETWFYKIAVREALMLLRPAAKKRRHEELRDSIPDGAETPEQFAERSIREQKLYEAIAKLNKRRKLAALYWLAGESTNEIAKRAKTSNESEKAARHKAKVALREMLA